MRYDNITFYNIISDEKYEELRLILERQSGRIYTLDEANEIGDGLIDFCDLLARLNIEEGHETQS